MRSVRVYVNGVGPLTKRSAQTHETKQRQETALNTAEAASAQQGAEAADDCPSSIETFEAPSQCDSDWTQWSEW